MRILFLVASICLLAISPAGADGLLYRLPDDGAYVRFTMIMESKEDGKTESHEGSLTMASVGRKEIDGQKCRWIEFRMIMNKQSPEVMSIKVLIPEERLKTGENAIDFAIKGWSKEGKRKAEEVKDLKNDKAVGPLRAFLCGPFKDAKKLPAEELDTKLGKLSCPGVTGAIVLDENRDKVSIQVLNRLNDKSPFGVVHSRMQYSVSSNRRAREQGTLTFQLVEVGKDAKSDLPD